MGSIKNKTDSIPSTLDIATDGNLLDTTNTSSPKTKRGKKKNFGTILKKKIEKQTKTNICSGNVANVIGTTNIDTSIPSVVDIWDELKNRQDSIQFFSQQYDDILNQYSSISKENHQLKNQNNKQFDEIVVLKQEVQRLSIIINDEAQAKMDHTLVFKNSPDVSPCQSKPILVDVANTVEVELRLEEINKVHRFPIKSIIKQRTATETKFFENHIETKSNCWINRTFNQYFRKCRQNIFIQEHMTQLNHIYIASKSKISLQI